MSLEYLDNLRRQLIAQNVKGNVAGVEANALCYLRHLEDQLLGGS